MRSMSSAIAAPVDAFIRSMHAVLPESQIETSDMHRFDVDGMQPAVAVAPATLSELRGVLTQAAAHRLALVPFGAGAHIALGNVPANYHIALSTARMSATIAHEPADLTVTVEAGARLSELQTLLANHNQFLPLDPPAAGSATVGGVLAANASGPLRHAFGTARDWLIGARVVDASGATSKSGGRVVKNVTGYDMHKLYVGSLGTLAVIQEATFKLAPLPPAETTLSAMFESAAAACVLILQAHDAGLALQKAELLSPTATQALLGEPRWGVLCQAGGVHGAIARTTDELKQLACGSGSEVREDIDAGVWQRWSGLFAAVSLSLRVNVMPSAVAPAVDALDRRLAGAAARISATVTAGLIRVRIHTDDVEAARTIVQRVGAVAQRHHGSMVVEAAPAALKREFDVFGPLRSDFAIMRRLKEQFDPARILAPGRFMGKL